MAEKSINVWPPRIFSLSDISKWLMRIISFGILAFIVMQLVIHFSTPVPLHRLVMVKDIPLPGVFPDANRKSNPVAPGLATRFDHFDFQALDPKTHLLFIAHTGPNPDKEHAVNPNFNPDKDSQTDGNVLVFDTRQNKVVRVLPIPQVAGVVVASDLGRVYVGDANDGIVYAVDEKTFNTTPIELDQFDSPDAMEYDQADHRIFVADPGTSSNPDKTANIDLKNQNVAIIDALTNKLVTKVQLGIHKPYGDDVGHIQFDPVSHRLFVVTLPLPNQDDPNAEVQPPSFLAVIDPLNGELLSRVRLPDACVNPHGMTIDVQQREAFIACIDSQNVARFDLRAMKPFPDASLLSVQFNPDIVRLDHSLHLLYVACATGISVFDESGRSLKKLGDYFLGGGSNHTIAINEQTHILYLPLPSVGGRPVLRIVRYVPNGE